MAAAADSEEVCIQIVAGGEASEANGIPVLVSLTPSAGQSRNPCDICCVVDVSGSMGAEAVLQTETGSSEGHGLSVLDIVKHSMKTIIRNLEDMDRLALVVYSNDARTIFELTKMDAEGRTGTETKLDELEPAGMTNLWDGLKTGIELLKDSQGKGRLQHIMLFTDGLPNINPPRGILPMLQRLKQKEGGRLPCTISTFGFGYELDSELLSELAISGCGAYAFIPDAGFVGTVFVNAMTNLLVTMAKDAILTISPTDGASFVAGGAPRALGGHPSQPHGQSLIVNLGSLQFGQTKDVVVHMNLPLGSQVQASLDYVTRQGVPLKALGAGCPEVRDKIRTNREVCRLMSVDSVRESMALAKQTPTQKAAGEKMKLKEAQRIISDVCKRVEAIANSHDAATQGLLEDLRGQVSEAISKEEWYTKWGVHYLPSLMCAHLAQVCNNFKDPGVQGYGGALFGDLRDKADDIFCSLPPPQPSARPQPQAMAVPAMQYSMAPMIAPAMGPRAAPMSMAAYYDRFAG